MTEAPHQEEGLDREGMGVIAGFPACRTRHAGAPDQAGAQAGSTRHRAARVDRIGPLVAKSRSTCFLALECIAFIRSKFNEIRRAEVAPAPPDQNIPDHLSVAPEPPHPAPIRKQGPDPCA